MIRAFEAYSMMPSTIDKEKRETQILEEVEKKIIAAAKNDKSYIEIMLNPIDFKSIESELKCNHYYIKELCPFKTMGEFYIEMKKPSHERRFVLRYPAYNPETHSYEFPYQISWDF